jgi:hypothetical protein
MFGILQVASLSRNTPKQEPNGLDSEKSRPKNWPTIQIKFDIVHTDERPVLRCIQFNTRNFDQLIKRVRRNNYLKLKMTITPTCANANEEHPMPTQPNRTSS